jgi:hypothetical protein
MFAQQLEFEFEFGCPYIEAEYYRDGAQDLIQKLVPADLLEASGVNLPPQRARFADMLPLITWSDLNKAPCSLSVLLLCKYRLNACNFFYDMVSRWLLPQKRVNVEVFFASDVRLPHLSDDLLSVAEIVVHLKSAQDVEEVRRNLYAVETEIRLGVVSTYHARRILEFKGLSTDGKTAMIQEKIGSLIQSHSKDYDQGIFSQMQHFLVTCQEDFKKARDYHHISRIISNLYSVQKLLKRNIEVFPGKRHVNLKFFKTKLALSGGKEKTVLGILAGLNFLRQHELFETDHLINAIQKYIPSIRFIKESALVDKAADSSFQTIYLEIEKSDGLDFSLDDIQLLRTALPDQIKSHIEQLTHPIFMPRNEEEVLRNIMALSRQLRFVSDIPQLIISFDEQKGGNLCFTVILLRIQEAGKPTAQELFASKRTPLKFVFERVRTVGHLRRKHKKEATVFRALIPSQKFLRLDHSVDLYKAREHVLKEIGSIIGEVRDFNGGMIYKQNESLNLLKATLGKVGEQNHLLLEKFFYSLTPTEMRSVLETEALKQLFLLLLQAMKSEERSCKRAGDWFFRQDARRVMAVWMAGDSQKKKRLSESLSHFGVPGHQLVSFAVETHESPYMGYMLLTDDRDSQQKFLTILEERELL